MNKREVWKDIPGYEGYYQASTYGRIRSLKRYYKNRILKPCLVKRRKLHYLNVCLTVDCKGKSWRVHRLIAMTFIPNTNTKSGINHIDNNPQNNRVDNLEWSTQKDNMMHSAKCGRLSGEKRVNAKLKLHDVVTMRALRKQGCTLNELAKKFNTCKSNVSQICNGRAWAYFA